MYESLAFFIGSFNMLMFGFMILVAILMVLIFVFKNDTLSFISIWITMAMGMGIVIPVGITMSSFLFENKLIEVIFETDDRTIVMTEYWGRIRESTNDEWGDWLFSEYHVVSVSGPDPTYEQRHNELNKD